MNDRCEMGQCIELSSNITLRSSAMRGQMEGFDIGGAFGRVGLWPL